MERLITHSSHHLPHHRFKPYPAAAAAPPAPSQLIRTHSSDLYCLFLPHQVVPLSRMPSSCFSILLNDPSPLDSSLLTPSSFVDSPTKQSPCQAGSKSFHEAVFAAKTILLSTLAMILIHPILMASPAFATFPGAAATSSGRGLLRTEILSSAWTGFFAGCLHTLSGPDHLAALAPLSIGRTQMESAVAGALWGCGHDAGQLIFGLLFLLLKDRLHIEIIRTWGTRVVGLTLLVIGGVGIKEASESAVPCVALENGDQKKIGFATFATGIVHGLQPDALMMILPALALPSRLAGASFLCMFLVGTVVAMGGYTVFISSCSQALKERVPRITEKLTWASSSVAIGLGLAILISHFFGFSLY